MLVQIVALSGVNFVFSEVRHSEDGVHRRANLVAHVGKEVRLHFGGFFGQLLSLPQRVLGLFALGNVHKSELKLLSPVVGEGRQMHFGIQIVPSRRWWRHSKIERPVS